MRGSTVSLVTGGPQAALPPGYALVPDVRGLSIRRAMNRLSTLQLDIDINGSGIVTTQNPAAGQQVKLGTRVTLQCQAPGVGT
jgi:beta-lactam-binding protein with PASTA domain